MNESAPKFLPLSEFPATIVVDADGDFQVTVPIAITDIEAQCFEFQCAPADLPVLGTFIAITDPDGTRIGCIREACWHKPINAAAYVIASVDLL